LFFCPNGQMCTREMAIIVPYSVQIQFIGTKKIMNTWHNVSMPTWNYHISTLDLINWAFWVLQLLWIYKSSLLNNLQHIWWSLVCCYFDYIMHQFLVLPLIFSFDKRHKIGTPSLLRKSCWSLIILQQTQSKWFLVVKWKGKCRPNCNFVSWSYLEYWHWSFI